LSIRVYIVEDQPKTLKGLSKVLETIGWIRLVGSSLDAETALNELERLEVDVVVLDLELLRMDGLEMLAHLNTGKGHRPEVLVWTAFEDEDKVFEAIRSGASGYVLKSTPPSKVAEAIRIVHEGGSVLQPVIARRFLNLFRSLETSIPNDDGCPLGQEEKDVLSMVARGLSNKETSHVLELSQRKVRSRLQSIYKKLGAAGRVEAVTTALSKGWLRLQ